jgi:murein DD-endopeptidase MepM/ murein hydrolase activator NlpD
VAEGRRLVYNRRRKESDDEAAAALTLYAYRAGSGDDLMRLAARCSVPYAALASLNHLEHNDGLDGRLLLLPTIPGLFIREDADSDFERLLLSSRDGAGTRIIIDSGRGKTPYRFIPGGDFTPTERALFLNPSLFRFPLKSYTITSYYGSRISPISGRRMNHQGLDLAAGHGADVYAIREGTVTFTGENAVYGNYVIITHDKGWTSLYGHLSRIETALNKKVLPGTIIGKVGSTGLSTGPHLHFELRQNGQSQDPLGQLK